MLARSFILGTYWVECSPLKLALEICVKSCVFSEEPVQNRFHLESPIVKFGAQAPKSRPARRWRARLMRHDYYDTYVMA
jgi:hypothetical protein